MKLKFYELVFDDSDEGICILGTREPSLEEATEFAAKDLAASGCSAVTAVGEISQQQAYSFYNISDDDMPVFGTNMMRYELAGKLRDDIDIPFATSSGYDINLFKQECSGQEIRPQEFRISLNLHGDMKQSVLEAIAEVQSRKFEDPVLPTDSTPMQFELLAAYDSPFYKEDGKWHFREFGEPKYGSDNEIQCDPCAFRIKSLVVNYPVTINGKQQVSTVEISPEDNTGLPFDPIDWEINDFYHKPAISKCIAEWGQRCCDRANAVEIPLPTKSALRLGENAEIESGEFQHDGLLTVWLKDLSDEQRAMFYDDMIHSSQYDAAYNRSDNRVPALTQFKRITLDTLPQYEAVLESLNLVPRVALDFKFDVEDDTISFDTEKCRCLSAAIYMNTPRNLNAPARMFQIPLSDEEAKAIGDNFIESPKFINAVSNLEDFSLSIRPSAMAVNRPEFTPSVNDVSFPITFQSAPEFARLMSVVNPRIAASAVPAFAEGAFQKLVTPDTIDDCMAHFEERDIDITVDCVFTDRKMSPENCELKVTVSNPRAGYDMVYPIALTEETKKALTERCGKYAAEYNKMASGKTRMASTYEPLPF